MNDKRQSSGRLSLDRLTALSDGVVAIVITILVLDLDVPQGHDFATSGLMGFLGTLEHQLLPYIASFALVAGYWVVHHVMLRFVETTDRPFVWLNLAFMLPLTLIPYVTEMRVDYRGEISVAALFGGTQLAVYGLLLSIWRYALRHLRTSPVEPRVARSMRIRILIVMGLNIVGVLLVPISERLAAIAFASTPFLFLKHHAVDHHCRTASSSAAQEQ